MVRDIQNHRNYNGRRVGSAVTPFAKIDQPTDENKRNEKKNEPSESEWSSWIQWINTIHIILSDFYLYFVVFFLWLACALRLAVCGLSILPILIVRFVMHLIPALSASPNFNRSLSHERLHVYIFIGYSIKLSFTLLSEVIKLVEKSSEQQQQQHKYTSFTYVQHTTYNV